MKTSIQLLILLVILSLGACNENPTDSSATISAQETRISELSLPEEDNEIEENPQETSVNEYSEETEQVENSVLFDDVTEVPSQENHLNETPETNQFELLLQLPKNHVVVSNEKIIVFYEGQWSVVDIESGQTLWTMENDSDLLLVDSNNLYLSPGSQRIDAYSLETGDLVWTALREEKGNPIHDVVWNLPGSIVIATNGSSIVINKTDGSIQAGLPLFKDIHNQVGIVEHITGFQAGVVEGYSLDGDLLWTREEVQIGVNCESAFLLFNRTNQNLEAIDINTGETLWSIHNDNKKFCTMTSVDSIYNTHEMAMELMADRSLLMIMSRYLTSDYINDSLTLFLSNDNTGDLTKIDLVNGNQLWKIEDNNEFRWFGEHGEVLIFISPDFAITKAINALTSEPIWQNEQIVLIEPPKLVDNKLISISDKKETSELVALDVNTGELIWSFDAGKIDSYTITNKYIAFQPGSKKPELQFIDVQTGMKVAEVMLPGEDLTSFDDADSMEVHGLLLTTYGDYVGVIRP